MATPNLTTEELIAAASRSEKRAVQTALEKLEFALRMSYTEEELIELTDLPTYHLRLGHKLEDEQYVYTVFRWCGEQFAVYTNTDDTNGILSGRGNDIQKDPAIVYMNKPRHKQAKIQGTK